jgi:hypothetical protein
LATSSNQRRTWPLATSAVSFRQLACKLADKGTRKLPLEVAVEALDLALGLRAIRSAQPQREAAFLGQLQQPIVPAVQPGPIGIAFDHHRRALSNNTCSGTPPK